MNDVLCEFSSWDVFYILVNHYKITFHEDKGTFMYATDYNENQVLPVSEEQACSFFHK